MTDSELVIMNFSRSNKQTKPNLKIMTELMINNIFMFLTGVLKHKSFSSLLSLVFPVDY